MEEGEIQLYDLGLSTLAVFFKQYQIEKEEAERKERKYHIALNISRDESKDFDVEYNPLASFVDEKSKLPLTSLYVEEKYNIERDKRGGRILYSGLTFLAFTILYLCILYYQIRVDYGSVVVASMRRRFVDGVNFQRPEYGETFTFNEVNDWGSLADWIVSVPLGTAKELSPETNSYNYMLGAEIKISFRLGITLPWSSQQPTSSQSTPLLCNIFLCVWVFDLYKRT